MPGFVSLCKTLARHSANVTVGLFSRVGAGLKPALQSLRRQLDYLSSHLGSSRACPRRTSPRGHGAPGTPKMLCIFGDPAARLCPPYGIGVMKRDAPPSAK